MFSRFDTITACYGRTERQTDRIVTDRIVTDRRTDVQNIAKMCFSIADARKKLTQEKRARWQKLEITSQQRTDLNLDGLHVNKNLSELNSGMLRQGILNSHNDFVWNYWIDGSWKWFNLAELAARRTGVNSDHEGVVFTKLKYRFTDFFRYLEYRLRYRYFEIPRYSVSVTDLGLMRAIPAARSRLNLAENAKFHLDQLRGMGLRPKTLKNWNCVNVIIRSDRVSMLLLL